MAQEPGFYWGSDVLISMPVPTKSSVIIDMGTFGLTEYGIDHNLTSVDIEEYLPTFAPEEARE